MKTTNRVRLTTTLIRGILCPPPRDGGRLATVFTYDDEVPGLAFVAASTGARYFALCRTLTTGEFKRITVGDVTIGLDAARKLAGAMNSKIAAGIDPVAERAKLRETTKAAKEAKKNAPTLANLWTAYRTEYLDRERKAITVKEFTRLYDLHLSHWADRPLAEITEADCYTLKSTVGERGPYQANRVLAVLSAMFRRAGRKFGLPRGTNPAAGVERYKESPHTHTVKPGEMAKVMAALDADENQLAADLFRMLIYTGARKANVTTMRWNDLHEVDGVRTWDLPGEVMKNGKPLKIALTPDALAVIDRRGECNPEGSQYVFPASRPTAGQIELVRKLRANGKSTRDISEEAKLSQSSVMRCLNPAYTAKPDAPFGGTASTWERVLKRAGVTHARIHDLRRTYVTNLITKGVPAPVVATIVGHKSTATTLRYYTMIDEETAHAAALEAGAKIAASLAEAKEKMMDPSTTPTATKARGRRKAG